LIKYNETERTIHLQTNQVSYIMQIFPTGHLGHLYFGQKLDLLTQSSTLITKFDIEVGNQVLYRSDDRTFNLNLAMLELSTYGKGDFRDPMLHFRLEDGSRITDFLFKDFKVLPEKPSFPELPEAKAHSKEEAETLMITVRDDAQDIEIDLYYGLFLQSDVITRRIVIRNGSLQNITIEKGLSMNLDMLNQDYSFLSLDGAWIRERNITEHHLEYGILKIDSKKGNSSNDHNPFIAIKGKDTSEEFGPCYGFSLIYSGNFEATLEVSPHQLLRVLFGIQSFDFHFPLKKNEHFVTPEVALTFSSTGISKLSQNFHEFVKKNIIPLAWQNKERPILINNWEATFFDFNEPKLLKLAKEAKKLGIELFVLDDGWFGKRNDDTSSLGDWFVNRKKLPSGIKGLADKINKIGLEFGIWVEPEMVNENSDLYRMHPNWAIKHPKYVPSLGRNQLILDLCNPEVRDYLFVTLSDLFSSAKITYVKWDMNRNISDTYSDYLSQEYQGALSHLYMKGLYELLDKLTQRFPNILFESCASGGNRYDLGMLCYMPQTWVSDNTDGVSRLKIQYGTSLVYPQSTMGAHVSAVPHQQTIRNVPLETRFNTAAFGLLGYELDLTKCTPFEKKVIKKQITFYKEHRNLLQFGKLTRNKSPFQTDECEWSVTSEDQKSAILGIYKMKQEPNSHLERFRVLNLNPSLDYHIKNRTQYFNLDQFGHLVKHALPIRLNANGTLFHLLKNRYLMKAEDVDFTMSGRAIEAHGMNLLQNFIGSGYNESVRLMGDYGSRIYFLKNEMEEEHAS